MAKSSYLKDNAKSVQGFTNALKRAQDFVQKASPAEIAKIIQPYFENVDVGLIETVVERYKSQGSYATEPILDKGNGITCKRSWRKQVNFLNG